MRSHIFSLPAALFSAAILSACNLDLGSGTTSAELDQALNEQIAKQDAAKAESAAQSSSSSGETQSATKSAESSEPVASTQASAGGFLWKPVSDSNGKLVVLLPSRYNGKVSSVTVNGEKGSFSGIANGNRTHWRFSKPGAGYGSNVRVVAATSSGNVTWTVPNGGRRTSL